MYRYKKALKTSLKVNQSYRGETIEQKIDRIVNNKEPITDGAPLVYTERKDGVRPEYDIRTDRWDVAIDAMDKVNKSKLAKRESRLKPDMGDKKEGGNDGSSGGQNGNVNLGGEGGA